LVGQCGDGKEEGELESVAVAEDYHASGEAWNVLSSRNTRVESPGASSAQAIIAEENAAGFDFADGSWDCGSLK
jgi:hypothetical protein